MSNTIKQFDYSVFKMEKGDGLPFNPHVVIELGCHAIGTNGAPVVSAHLMSDGEIDEHIGHLKADLDAVAKLAKAALRKAKVEPVVFVADRQEDIP